MRPPAVASPNVLSYVNLVGEAVQLARELATIERDCRAIEAEHEERMTALNANIALMETTLAGELEERQELRRMLHEQVRWMIQAGDREAALIINRRMMDKFQTSIVAEVLRLKNTLATSGMIELRPKYD